MESTNFEFLRSRWPKLAKRAATIEASLHDDPGSAAALIRALCESLLRTRFDREDGQLSLGKLLSQHSDAIPLDLRTQLEPITSLGNRELHSGANTPDIEINDALRHLKSAFDLAVWFVTEKTGERPDVEFARPPRGGRELHEAMKRIGERPQDLSDWIDPTMEGPFKAAPDDSYVGRKAIIDDIRSLLVDGEQRILIVGEPGRGKTRLLKEMRNRGILAEHGDVFSWFFSTQRASTTGASLAWLRHVYASVLRQFDQEHRGEDIHRATSDQLLNRLCERLRKICAEDEMRRIVLVIDAVDEAGDAKPDVQDFLRDRLPALPPQVIVVATMRPGRDHLPAGLSPSINLERQKRLKEHRRDGREYVNQRLAELRLPEDLKKEIAKVGDGNFQALTHICHQVPEYQTHDDIRRYLKKLHSSPDVLTGIYDEWWSRLESQAEPDDLDSLVSMAALVSAAQAPISDEIIRAILKPRKKHWLAFKTHLTEYLRKSERAAPTSESGEWQADETDVYRYYHATFAAFIREEFPDEIATAQNQLANFCCDWKARQADWYARDYALRFAVTHCAQTSRWSDVVNLLTDLKFIQARFESGQGYELLADYDRALKSHPDSEKRTECRFEASRRWVQQLVEYGRACSEIRRRHSAGILADPIAEIRKLALPEPPDTQEVERLMRETDYVSRSSSQTSRKPSSFDQLSEYRAFVSRYFHYIDAFSHLTVSIARKHATSAIVAAAHQINDDTADLLHRAESRQSRPYSSLIIHEIAQPGLPDDGSGASGGMNRDASLVLGAMCSHDTHFWDGTTGRRCEVNAQNADVCCISVDSRFGVFSQIKHENQESTIQLVSLRDGRILAELTGHRPLVFWPDDDILAPLTAQMTPDASLVAFLDADDSEDRQAQLIIWHPFDAEGEVRSFPLNGLLPQRVLLAPSGTAALVCFLNDDEELVGRIFDLIRNTFTEIVPWDEIPDLLGDSRPEFRLANGLQRPLSSIDGRIAIRQGRSNTWSIPESEWINDVDVLVDGKLVRSFGNERPFNRVLGLSADGRLAVVNTSTFLAVLDLAEGVWREPSSSQSNESVDSNVQADSQSQPPASIEEHTVELMDLRVDRWIKISEQEIRITGIGYYRERDEDPEEPEFQCGIRRTRDGQVVCTFPFVCDAVASLDGTRWALKKSEEPKDLDSIICRIERRREGGLSDDKETREDDDRCGILDVTSGRYIDLSDSTTPIGWTRDGRSLCTWSEETGLQLRDGASGEILNREFPIPDHAGFQKHDRNVRYSSMPFGPHLEMSPDGRRIAWTNWWDGPPTIVALNSCEITPFADVIWAKSQQVSFAPDARNVKSEFAMIEGPSVGSFLWDVRTGECLDLIGEDCAVEICVPETMIPWVTSVRIFRPHLPMGTGRLADPLCTDCRIPGRFDDELTFRCPICNHWSPLPGQVQDAIRSIHRTARLTEADSPVLKLPDAAWDSEDALFFSCPRCSESLKSTPFVVDHRETL